MYDPVRGELFSTLAGSGAFLNGRRIRTSDEDQLIRCLVATGFPNEIRTAKDKNLRKFAKILLLCPQRAAIRVGGLDLCYVAAGRLDGSGSSRSRPGTKRQGS